MGKNTGGVAPIRVEPVRVENPSSVGSPFLALHQSVTLRLIDPGGACSMLVRTRRGGGGDERVFSYCPLQSAKYPDAQPKRREKKRPHIHPLGCISIHPSFRPTVQWVDTKPNAICHMKKRGKKQEPFSLFSFPSSSQTIFLSLSLSLARLAKHHSNSFIIIIHSSYFTLSCHFQQSPSSPTISASRAIKTTATSPEQRQP